MKHDFYRWSNIVVNFWFDWICLSCSCKISPLWLWTTLTQKFGVCWESSITPICFLEIKILWLSNPVKNPNLCHRFLWNLLRTMRRYFGTVFSRLQCARVAPSSQPHFPGKDFRNLIIAVELEIVSIRSSLLHRNNRRTKWIVRTLRQFCSWNVFGSELVLTE